ncbi:Signal peptidase complex catalytic subunit SEC11 [Grifola frondosa]|uniref:Signal peptidase complex catalytic subunit SEC11 n=1 Tax=Grifola frondosa TaxID=5627 RepID=A0A1C7MH49_GRIFR|nr:Signal peptidase complex catalytic subunit SEC11 [Grifola frondosa]
MFADELKTLRRLGFRHVLLQILNFASVLASGLMIWKGLGLITNTESPIVVVLSGSMEPAFYRGDLLFLTNPANQRYQTGDITVYKIPGADIPIVHRVLETHDGVTEKKKRKDLIPAAPLVQRQLLLTKGDNNHIDDIELYQGLEWLERKHIVGKVRGFLPYVGYVTIAMNDFPQLKYALLGATSRAYAELFDVTRVASVMIVVHSVTKPHSVIVPAYCMVESGHQSPSPYTQHSLFYRFSPPWDSCATPVDCAAAASLLCLSATRSCLQ